MNTKQPKVFIKTYGCQMNKLDSELSIGSLAKNGYAFADDVEDADVILLNTCRLQRVYDLSNDKFVEGPIPVYIADSISQKISRYTVKNNDIVITIVGVNIGDMGIITEALEGANLTENAAKISTNSDVCDPKFLLCQLSTPYNKFKFQQIAAGAAQGKLGLFKIKGFKVTLPRIDIQKNIVEIYFTYTFLINTNRRRIQLLEESARLLFREWFVYFRFPLRLRSGQAGHEKVKIVDGLPEGWEKRKLVEVADIVMGQSPKSEYYNDNGVGLPFHQGVTGFGDRYPTNQTYCTQKNRMAQAGDILFSVRAPVGRINIATEKIIIGRGLSAIRSKDNHQSYLFHELKNHFFKEDMIGVGAIFAAITKNDLETVVVIYPDEKTIEQFESITNPIDMQIKILSKENQKLAQARDLLLPRLMSGAIDPVRYDKLSNWVEI